MAERCTILVVPRDRYSTTSKCLDRIFSNTPEPHELLAVIGGAPSSVRKELERRYADKVQFVFKDEFLSAGAARNIGLPLIKSRLAVIIENDIYVRKGWLTPLIQCQLDTGAAMVVPLVLEAPKVIHTAGNDLLMTYENGKPYAIKVLRYAKKPYCDSSNLKRVPTDYGELHCQLVVVETAIRHHVYDDKLREVGECDCGLSWKKAGCSMWFEPASVVQYDIPNRVCHVEDICFFAWRWEMRGILEGYRYFHQKWNMDITEYGRFKFLLLELNRCLGLLPRLFPYRLALWIDHGLYDLRKMMENSLKVWQRMKGAWLGFYDWNKL